tara:strand:+ start:673 stop:912 length:240 start_codon:yes stop_codon:yes gene_type:complete
MNLNVLDDIYWDALKMKESGDPDASYTDLGGNSIGIFKITSSIKERLGITIDPVILLSDDASLNNLKKAILNEGSIENV